jgi:hypothetical protein
MDHPISRNSYYIPDSDGILDSRFHDIASKK